MKLLRKMGWKHIKEKIVLIPREEKILETIQKSKNVMMEVQSENMDELYRILFSQSSA